MKSLSRVRLLATPWTAAYQAPPSMGFSRQEYWSGLSWLRTINTYYAKIPVFPLSAENSHHHIPDACPFEDEFDFSASTDSLWLLTSSVTELSETWSST